MTRKNSSAKGKAGEKYVVELLKEWWKDPQFQRNWMGQSGAVGTMLEGRSDVPQDLLIHMTGDIICPPDFPFSVESKFYEEIDLYEILRNPKATVCEFWRQCRDDAKRINKIPLVIFRENRKQAYCLFPFRFDSYSCNLGFQRMSFYVDGETVWLAAWDKFSSFYTKEKVKEVLQLDAEARGRAEHGVFS